MKLITLSLVAFFFSACTFINPKSQAEHKFPDHIQSGLDYLKYNEYSQRQELRELLDVDPVVTEWCAAFVNEILAKNGIPGSESVSNVPLMARSFLKWGEPVATPAIGDIVVFPRGNSGWKGHVGFYMGSLVQDDIEWYLILGGNQDNEVNMTYYRASKAIGIRTQK